MWIKSIFVAFILAIFGLSSEVDAGSRRGPNYDVQIEFFKKMSTAIGPLLGPSHHFMNPKKRDRRNDTCSYKSDTGMVQCMEYVSDYDRTEWRLLIDKDADGFRRIKMFKRSTRGTMEPYASIVVIGGDNPNRVVLHGDEPRKYAGVTNSTFIAGGPNDRGPSGNLIEDASKELERALGTAIPGKALPPLKLPSFGR